MKFAFETDRLFAEMDDAGDLWITAKTGSIRNAQIKIHDRAFYGDLVVTTSNCRVAIDGNEINNIGPKNIIDKMDIVVHS